MSGDVIAVVAVLDEESRSRRSLVHWESTERDYMNREHALQVMEAFLKNPVPSASPPRAEDGVFRANVPASTSHSPRRSASLPCDSTQPCLPPTVLARRLQWHQKLESAVRAENVRQYLEEQCVILNVMQESVAGTHPRPAEAVMPPPRDNEVPPTEYPVERGRSKQGVRSDSRAVDNADPTSANSSALMSICLSRSSHDHTTIAPDEFFSTRMSCFVSSSLTLRPCGRAGLVLCPGDRLVAIDGVPTTCREQVQVWDSFGTRHSTYYVTIVRRDRLGGSNRVSIRLAVSSEVGDCCT